jgi:hypothetical protein
VEPYIAIEKKMVVLGLGLVLILRTITLLHAAKYELRAQKRSVIGMVLVRISKPIVRVKIRIPVSI